MAILVHNKTRATKERATPGLHRHCNIVTCYTRTYPKGEVQVEVRVWLAQYDCFSQCLTVDKVVWQFPLNAFCRPFLPLSCRPVEILLWVPLCILNKRGRFASVSSAAGETTIQARGAALEVKLEAMGACAHGKARE